MRRTTAATRTKATAFVRRFSTNYPDDHRLYYYGLRYYNPELGRWINRDPIEENGGLGLYTWNLNNSVMFLDILGESPLVLPYLVGRVMYRIYQLMRLGGGFAGTSYEHVGPTECPVGEALVIDKIERDKEFQQRFFRGEINDLLGSPFRRGIWAVVIPTPLPTNTKTTFRYFQSCLPCECATLAAPPKTDFFDERVSDKRGIYEDVWSKLFRRRYMATIQQRTRVFVNRQTTKYQWKCN